MAKTKTHGSVFMSWDFKSSEPRRAGWQGEGRKPGGAWLQYSEEKVAEEAVVHTRPDQEGDDLHHPLLKRRGDLVPTSTKVLLCIYSKTPAVRWGPSSPLSPLCPSQPTVPHHPSTLLGTHFTCVLSSA